MGIEQGSTEGIYLNSEASACAAAGARYILCSQKVVHDNFLALLLQIPMVRTARVLAVLPHCTRH